MGNKQKKRELFTKGLKRCFVILAAGVLLCGCDKNDGETVERVGADGKAQKNPASGLQTDVADSWQDDSGQQAEIFMIKVKDQIYVDTGKISTLPRCGMMDGKITSTVKYDEFPEKNDQSNFGKDYGYQFGGNDTIHVNMDGQWRIFTRQLETDIHSITITNGTTGEKLEISRSEQVGSFWEIVKYFEALEVEKSENQTPTTGYTYWLRMFDEAEGELHSVSLKSGEKLEIDNVCYRDDTKGTAAKLLLAVDALWETDKAMADLESTDRQGTDALEGVSMVVSYATSKGGNLIFSNDTELEIYFGDSYILQKYVDDTWYEVGYLVDNWAVNAIAYNVPKGGFRSWSVRWEWLHGELEPGTYRIVKDVMDFRGTGDYTTYYLGAEFTVE